VYFVREVPRSQVIVFRETSGHGIEIVKPRLKTLGSDVGEISHFVFEDERFGALFEELGDRLRNEPEKAPILLDTLADEVSNEALMNLKRRLAVSDDEEDQ
jgi:hypothetical protein